MNDSDYVVLDEEVDLRTPKPTNSHFTRWDLTLDTHSYRKRLEQARGEVSLLSRHQFRQKLTTRGGAPITFCVRVEDAILTYNLGAIGPREAHLLAAVDALLAHPVAQGLFDDPEFLGHVNDSAMLVNDQCGRVPTELLRVTTSTSRWTL